MCAVVARTTIIVILCTVITIVRIVKSVVWVICFCLLGLFVLVCLGYLFLLCFEFKFECRRRRSKEYFYRIKHSKGDRP